MPPRSEQFGDARQPQIQGRQCEGLHGGDQLEGHQGQGHRLLVVLLSTLRPPPPHSACARSAVCPRGSGLSFVPACCARQAAARAGTELTHDHLPDVGGYLVRARGRVHRPAPLVPVAAEVVASPARRQGDAPALESTARATVEPIRKCWFPGSGTECRSRAGSCRSVRIATLRSSRPDVALLVAEEENNFRPSNVRMCHA